ncbi:MAG TPA: hypothetical protein PK820_09100 [Candidatus Competibacteraceae bacterium]|nr:hypothetical protein [Candidatus Competibacteraceae bacterium]HPF58934.1 hypothetical protein [Candidatus Competibacteraceae bacterium]
MPDWWIQAAWWGSGIFATGAVWYFLSTGKFWSSVAAAIAALVLAGVAIVLHQKKDSLEFEKNSAVAKPVGNDQVVSASWWEESELRKEYVDRGFEIFRWSNQERVKEREKDGYEVVYLVDSKENSRHRVVSKGGQVLIAKKNA